MFIRLASIDDIDAVMKVEKLSFIPGIQEEKTVFEQRIKCCPELFLIFQEGDKAAGYLSAEIMNKIPYTPEELALGHLPATYGSFSNGLHDKYIYISSFAILPEFRGNGAGKKMWNNSVDFLKSRCGINNFILLVNEEWKGAFHIYESSGFKEVRRFPDFFVSDKAGKSDGILMLKIDN